MKHLNFILAAGLLAACTPTSDSPVQTEATTEVNASAPSCAGLDPCVLGGNIAVLGDGETAQDLIATAQQGARQFAEYFGQTPKSIAIVPGGVVSADLETKIRAAGFELILPWMSESDQMAFKTEAVRRQVEEQTKGMPEEQRNTIMDMALSQIKPSGPVSAKQKGVLTHELGHLWFIGAFERRAQTDGETKNAGHGYGGWAPDWLDEAAAVLMENDTLTQSRRAAFQTEDPGGLYPLREFLTMEHPAAKSAQELLKNYQDKNPDASVKEGESRAIFLTGDDADEFLKNAKDHDPVRFYTQTRGFVDFLTEQTHDPQVIAKIAAHLARDHDFENWLLAQSNLPDSMEGLEALWTEWAGL